MDAVSADDEQLVRELQRRFKPTVGGREPAPANLRAAITLARSPGCRPAEVFRQFSIPTGGSRSRVIDYRDRIVRDNLLPVASAGPLQTPQTQPGPTAMDTSHVAEPVLSTSFTIPPERPAAPVAAGAGSSTGSFEQRAHRSSDVTLQLADRDDGGSRMESRPGAELDDVLEVTMQLEPLLDAKVQHAREQQRVRQARYAKRKLTAMHSEWSELTPAEQQAAACFGLQQREVMGLSLSERCLLARPRS